MKAVSAVSFDYFISIASFNNCPEKLLILYLKVGKAGGEKWKSLSAAVSILHLL